MCKTQWRSVTADMPVASSSVEPSACMQERRMDVSESWLNTAAS